MIHLRNEENTLEDWVLICSRNVSKFKVSCINTTPVRHAYTNLVVAENNHPMLMSLNNSVYAMKAVHNSPKATKLSTDEFGGSQPVPRLCVGPRLMLLLYSWTEVGLCNGSMGEVKSLIYKENVIPPSLPIASLMKFDNYNGPTFYNTNFIHICPVSLASCAVENCERQQTPLTQSGL